MVFLFDSSGHHVSSIQHSDIDDPFRPYVMRDIAVDEKNNDIFILDSHKKRIFNYDFNGNCKDSIIKLDYPAQSIKSNTNGDLLIQNKSSTFQLRPILYNLERQSGFKTISFKYFGSHQGDGMFHREISNFSYGNNGSIIYSNYLSDTIYRVTGGVQFIPYYYADFQEAKAPASFFSSLEDNSSWYSKLKQSDYGVKLGYFVENENCIMFPFYKGGNAYLFYKKLASGQPLICQYPNFGFNIPRAPIGFYDAGLILSLESSAVPKFISFVSKEGYVMTNFENELFHFFENS